MEEKCDKDKEFEPSAAQTQSEQRMDNATGNTDDDLDSLLDSALEDFDKADDPPLETLTYDGPLENAKGAAGAAGDTAASEQERMFNELFADAAQAQHFEDMMKAFMGGNAELMGNMQNLATAAAQSDTSEEAEKQFDKTLRDTVSSLSENAQQLQNDVSDEELMRMLSGLGLGAAGAEGSGGNGGAAGGDFLPMMQTMMKSILSKDVLYPSLKDVADKYPAFLEEKKGQISEKDHSMYTQQYELMRRICGEFEQESDFDSQSTKERRLETVMDLMDKMRELGEPPRELVGDMPPGFDASMFGNLAGSSEQCSVM